MTVRKISALVMHRDRETAFFENANVVLSS